MKFIALRSENRMMETECRLPVKGLFVAGYYGKRRTPQIQSW
jgi:hypothetical protein